LHKKRGVHPHGDGKSVEGVDSRRDELRPWRKRVRKVKEVKEIHEIKEV
jgi:hypothetical protein